jgi:hypothetical protein
MGIPEPPVRTTVASTTTLSRVSQEVRIVAKIATGVGRAKPRAQAMPESTAEQTCWGSAERPIMTARGVDGPGQVERSHPGRIPAPTGLRSRIRRPDV